MQSVSNYWLIWSWYLLASTVFFIVFWRFTRFEKAIAASYFLRTLTIALVLTPWYANSESNVLAPALMVLALDVITIGGSAAARAIVPLLLSVILALIVASALLLLRKKMTNKAINNK